MAAPTPEVQINQTIRPAGFLDDRPQTLHEAVTREMVVQMRQELAEIRARVNGLIFTVIAAVVVQLVLVAGGYLGGR